MAWFTDRKTNGLVKSFDLQVCKAPGSPRASIRYIQMIPSWLRWKLRIRVSRDEVTKCRGSSHKSPRTWHFIQCRSSHLTSTLKKKKHHFRNLRLLKVQQNHAIFKIQLISKKTFPTPKHKCGLLSYISHINLVYIFLSMNSLCPVSV